MHYQLIRLDPADTGKAEWLTFTPGEPPETVSRGGLEEALKQAAGKPAVLIVPGEQTLMTSVELPIRQVAKLRKAIPFALEEKLASDVEELHFALGDVQGERKRVVIVENSLMNEWTVELGELGVTPIAVIPDVLALPWHEDEWSVLIDGDRALVRSGPTSGFVCEKENLTMLIDAHLEEEKAPLIVRYWNCSDGPDLLWPVSRAAEAPSIKKYSCGGGALRVLAQGWDPRASLNLLQDRYSQQADALKMLKPWRWAAALFGLWLAIGFGQNLAHKHQLEKRQTALRQQAEQIYKRTFPGAKRIVNPRVQMEQKLKALKGGGKTAGDSQFLPLLAQGSQALNQQSGLKLEKIGYRNGELSLEVSAPSLTQLDSLKQKLATTPGLAAELKSADSNAGGATGQIRIRQKR
ncbi:MAG TPA: type II secretion system protein GspL [Gammaproteobacteria bacterium]|nr:type II secretion system protein GspL [Gammaproteobacteria bacterium]